MGYRSDVAYVIKFKNISDRDSFVTLMLARNDPVLTEAVNETLHRSEDPVICAEFVDVRWRSDYPDVAVHLKMLAEASDLYDAGYRFCRVGENMDDVEETVHSPESWDCDTYDYVYVVRKVGTAFPAQPADGEKQIDKTAPAAT
jgi:hypothetical protein